MEDNFIAHRKFSSYYNIKILYRLWGKYFLFSLNFVLKGNNSSISVQKTYNVKIKSEMCKWSISHI